MFQWLGDKAAHLSHGLDWVVERLCALLLIALVLDVWLGVFVRYVVPLPLTFTEELARYLMIWTALLAISCGIAKREHIGVAFFIEKLPRSVRRWLLLGFDIIAFGFFAFLFMYGLDMVERGGRTTTMVFGMSKALPFAAVPTAAALACIQLVLVAIRDQARYGHDGHIGMVR